MKCPHCNETGHEPTAKYCHVCGTSLAKKKPKETPIRGYPKGHQHRIKKRDKKLRILLFIALLVEAVIVSIVEWKINIPWSWLTITMVNFSSVAMAGEQIESVNEGLYERDNRISQLYNKWLFFPISMGVIIGGLLVLNHFQNFWTTILDTALLLTTLYMYTGFKTLLDR